MVAIQSSATKRLLVRLGSGGKKEGLNRKIEKEEREYLKAFTEEKNLQDRVDLLTSQRTQLRAAVRFCSHIKRIYAQLDVQQQDLTEKADNHKALSEMLERIYTDVFAGPSPGAPTLYLLSIRFNEYILANRISRRGYSGANVQAGRVGLQSGACPRVLGS